MVKYRVYLAIFFGNEVLCKRQMLRYTLWSLPPSIHIFIFSASIECGRHMTCLNPKVTEYMLLHVHNYVAWNCNTHIGKKLFFPLLPGRSKLLCCALQCSKGKELSTASGQKPSRKWEPLSSSLQTTEFCQQLYEFGSRFPPIQTS